MTANGKPLIHMSGITKVFLTDEVETHALQDIHFEIQKGEYVAISGPSGLWRQLRSGGTVQVG